MQDKASSTINNWQEIIPVEPNGTTLDHLGWPLIRILGPQFGETVNISEVTRARKVKFDAQVAEQELRPLCKILGGGWEGAYPQLKFFRTSGIVQKESS